MYYRVVRDESGEQYIDFKGTSGRALFNDVTRELAENQLFWTDYKPNTPTKGVDQYGLHATELGWRVIEHIWQDIRKPEGAPTGPNL